MQIVQVKFENSNKPYSFGVGGINPSIKDEVVVESAMGLSLGTVVGGPMDFDGDESEIKDVIRIATPLDKQRNEQLKARAEKDIALVREKVKKLGLTMKIVSARYTLDASKIIIEFSADDRVDFRELLKELASALRVRIELHQVGQRDEVKIKGGIGPCGQICCCARFLNDFEHVTVKMAKNQGLSLSPTKISGLCGRLMCCLAYENGAYEDALKRMPKVGSEISTPKGRGTVAYNDLLKEIVTVKIKGNDDSFTSYEFPLAELNAKPGEKPQEERPKQARENQDSPRQDKPRQDKPQQDKPRQEKPDAQKPRKGVDAAEEKSPSNEGEQNQRRPRNRRRPNFNKRKENKNGI